MECRAHTTCNLCSVPKNPKPGTYFSYRLLLLIVRRTTIFGLEQVIRGSLAHLLSIHTRIYLFVLCFRIVSIDYFNTPSLEEGGPGGNPGADLHTAPPFQHPYTRKSTTTPFGANSVFAGLPMVKLSKNNNKYIRTRLPHQCTWYSVYRVYIRHMENKWLTSRHNVRQRRKNLPRPMDAF